MYCSTCGALVPNGRRTCDTCGARLAAPEPRTALPTAVPGIDGVAATRAAAVSVCPRCDFEGPSIPYFSRGPHMFGLVAATMLTLPGAFGAGGFLYYGLRHDHRICPRCGQDWGKGAARALPVLAEHRRPRRAEEPISRTGNEGVMRVWSIMLMVLGVVLLAAGIFELELFALVLGLVSGGGGFLLHRAANSLREKRRAALLASLQLPVLKLAAERNGRLTVTEVAASLGWPIRRAEKVLQSLDDGWRVDSEVTDEGVIVYEFRELLLGGNG